RGPEGQGRDHRGPGAPGRAARPLDPSRRPLVFAMVQEPAKLGLAPGPGVTGVAFAIPIKNQLAAFRLVNPKGVRIGVIYKEDNSGHSVEEAIKAATLLRVVMSTRAVTPERDIPPALRSLLAGDQAIDALWIPPDPVLL